jgi:hypothetical protein
MHGIGTRGAIAAALTCAMACAASSILAQDAGTLVGIEYAAPDGCPAAHALLSEIRRRTSLANVTEASGQPAAFVVLIRRSSSIYVGSIRSLTSLGEVADRQLEAATCEEVVSAIALVVALALDPNADTSALPWNDAGAPDASPAAPAAPLIVPFTSPVSSAPPPAPPSLPAPPERLPSAWWVSAHAILEPHTVAPGMMPGAGASLEYDVGHSLWAPTVRLSGFYAQTTVHRDAGGAKIQWYGGRLDIGTLPLRTAWLQAGPFVGMGAGALRAEGLIARPNESTHPWADASVTLRARVLIASSFALAAEGGVVAPLTRYTYDFRDPDHLFYRIPDVGGRLWLGASWRIP